MDKILARMRSVLTSREAATVLVLAWALLLAVWIIPFEFAGVSAERIRDIVYREPFFRLLYALIAAYTAICVVTRAVNVIGRALRAPSPENRPTLPEDATAIRAEWDESGVAARVQRHRFGATVSGDRWIWAVRRRWSAVGGLLFHLGIVVILLAGLWAASIWHPFRGDIAVAQKETFKGDSQEWTDMSVAQRGAPDVAFTVQDIDVRFRDETPVFNVLRATVTDLGGRSHRASASSPWLLDPMTTISAKDFGYSLSTVSSTEATTEPEQTAKLKPMRDSLIGVSPGPVTDSFTVPVGIYLYRVHVTVYGDYDGDDETPSQRSHALRQPRMLLSVDQVLTSGAEIERVSPRLVQVGQNVLVPGGAFKVTNVGYYGVFRVRRMPETPLLIAGGLCLLTGLAMRLLWPRQEVTIVAGEGCVHLIVVDDSYRRDLELEKLMASGYEESK